MNIEHLAGQRVKIGKTSITMKDENGKTRGIVNSITKFKEARSSQQMEYLGKLRAAGVWGSRIDGIMDNVIFDNNRLYFLHDLKPLETYNKYFAGRPGFEAEAERAAERERIAENMKEFSTVIPCYFE